MKNIEIQKRKKMETYGLKVFMCKNFPKHGVIITF